MASVTNIIISGCFSEEEEVVIEKQLLKYTGIIMPFQKIDNCKVGGDKCLEASFYMASFRNFDDTLFVETIHGINKLVEANTWESVQVMIKSDRTYDIWATHLASELTEELI
jgi:hypothetical protein